MASAGTGVASGGRTEQLLDELRGLFAENERLHREVARLTDLLRSNGIEPD